MRKLMWFSIGFAATCGIGANFLHSTALLWLALGCLLIALLILLTCREKVRFVAVVALGCAIGACWFWLFDLWQLDMLRQLDAHTVSLSAEITDYSYETTYGCTADAVTQINGKRYRVRLYTDEENSLWPGDQVHGEFRLRLTAGGVEDDTYHKGDGIFLLAYPMGEQSVTRVGTSPARYFPAVMRNELKTLLKNVFPEDAAGFACALLLGDSGELSYAQDTAFRVSGIRHVIAVSGLHVSILFSLVYTIAGKKRGLTAMLGIPVLLLFAAVTGFTPPVTRACVMQLVMILALLVGREYDPPTALSLAVLIMLAVNPLAVTSVSLQLSTACMIGILFFSEKLQGYLMRVFRVRSTAVTRWITGAVSVALSATVMTMPLCAWYFGSVSLIGIVTNLLTLWVISFIFYGILLVCLTGYLWLPISHGIAWLIAWPIRYVLAVARWLSAFPWAAVYTSSLYTVLWLVFCYALLAIFLCSKRKRAGVLAACVLLGLFLSIGANALEPRLENYRVTVLDVGQGQCILLQSRGSTYLVDCGGDSDIGAADLAAETLLSQGIRHLDGLILTHDDRDHTGGAAYLLSRIEVGAVYMPLTAKEIYGVLAQDYGDKLCRVGQKSVFSCGDARITVFPGTASKSDNESSLCILFQAENCDILITDDRSTVGERHLLENAELPKLEVLIVGHHGAGDAAGMELLRATMPDVAVISVGGDNRYGHPNQETLARLLLFGCQIRRTDQEGTIIIRG